MKTEIRILLTLMMAMSIASCSPTFNVKSHFDKDVDFRALKTFSILGLQQKDKKLSAANSDQVIKSVRSEMIKKGFQETNENPDINVNATVVISDEKEFSANTHYYNYDGVYRPYGWGPGSASAYTTADVKSFTAGSMIIDVVDHKTNKLIWEGIVSKEINSKAKNPQANIAKAVKATMKTFPPKNKSSNK